MAGRGDSPIMECKVFNVPPASPDAGESTSRIGYVTPMPRVSISASSASTDVEDEPPHDDEACERSQQLRKDALKRRLERRGCEESRIHYLRNRDYTAEEWQMMYMAVTKEHYMSSVALLCYVEVDGMKWAVCTRFAHRKFRGYIRLQDWHEEAALATVQLMRPQFRFLIYVGTDEECCTEVKTYWPTNEQEVEQILRGDVAIWQKPVVLAGTPLCPDVECLVPYASRESYLVEVTGLPGIATGYVPSGVGLPVLEPSWFLRKYFKNICDGSSVIYSICRQLLICYVV